MADNSPAETQMSVADVPPEGSASERPRRRWRRWLAVAVIVLAVDLAQPPSRQLSAHVLAGSISLYQASLSKLMPRLGVQCRFEPSCSHYGKASIEKYGAVRGSYRTAKRVLRCNPWTPLGTVDPP